MLFVCQAHRRAREMLLEAREEVEGAPDADGGGWSAGRGDEWRVVGSGGLIGVIAAGRRDGQPRDAVADLPQAQAQALGRGRAGLVNIGGTSRTQQQAAAEKYESRETKDGIGRRIVPQACAAQGGSRGGATEAR